MNKDSQFMNDHYTKREVYLIDNVTQKINLLDKKIKFLTHYTLLIECCRSLENRDLINLFENSYHDMIECLDID